MASRTIVFRDVVARVRGTGEVPGTAANGRDLRTRADTSGALLPGTTVTVDSPRLFKPRVAVTSAVGTYRIPELPIGTYSVTFELPAFARSPSRTSA
jgi:hypothetical protein